MTTILDSARDRALDLIRRYKHQVDYLAIRLEASEGSDVLLRGFRVETLSEGMAIGGHVRVCHRGGWGFSSFNRLDQLEMRVEEAISAARLVGTEETMMAEIKIIEEVCRMPMEKRDPRQVSLAEKKALCEHYGEVLRSVDSRITTLSVRYGDLTQRSVLVTSEGTMIDQTWADLEMRFSATARSGDQVQTGRETMGSRRGFDDLRSLEVQVQSAAERAVSSLLLPTVQIGRAHV